MNDTIHHVFVYGTLKPGHRAWGLIRDEAVSIERETLVDFALIDIGAPLAISSIDDHIDGYLIEFNPSDMDGVLKVLDAYEGVGRNNAWYREVVVVAHTVAWIYAGKKLTEWQPALDLDENEIAGWNNARQEVLR